MKPRARRKSGRDATNYDQGSVVPSGRTVLAQLTIGGRIAPFPSDARSRAGCLGDRDHSRCTVQDQDQGRLDSRGHCAPLSRRRLVAMVVTQGFFCAVRHSVSEISILVVDDDPDSLTIVRTYLEARGYIVA